MSLDRFKEAQAKRPGGYVTARAEMEQGAKESHWIWYVFPQLEELGRSSAAKFYGIEGINEACEYLRDEELRRRLFEITGIVASQLDRGVPVTSLMGSETDALKLVSSLTLFESAAKRMELDHADDTRAWFLEKCAQALALTARQGIPRCERTAAAISR